MDKTELVIELIQAGEKLIIALDKTNFKVTAAMWFYLSETNEWRLIIASPYVDSNGPKKSYEFIQEQLASLSPGSEMSNDVATDIVRYLSLENISVISPKDKLIKLMRPALGTTSGIFHIRFTKNAINNVLIEDAYIYRMT